MSTTFGDIPWCLNQSVGILIGASNWKEHNETLELVFQNAEDYEVTFNKPKCVFSQAQITFHGYQFGRGGREPTQEKVQAIHQCPGPASKEEVFLAWLGISPSL